MLNEKVAKLLNTQINKEFYSAYLYLSFSNFYDDKGLDGFANWYQVQAQEERDHAMLFVKYMQNNDLPITFEAIDKPDVSGLKENIDPLKAALKHEQYVTELIHTIYDAAAEAKDFRTVQFLDWFVKEQGEEETNATVSSSKRWSYSVQTPKGCICWIKSSVPVHIRRLPLPCKQTQFKGAEIICPFSFIHILKISTCPLFNR